MKTKDLNISTRTANALIRSGYNTLRDILQIQTKEELMKIHQIGPDGAKEIINAVRPYKPEFLTDAWKRPVFIHRQVIVDMDELAEIIEEIMGALVDQEDFKDYNRGYHDGMDAIFHILERGGNFGR